MGIHLLIYTYVCILCTYIENEQCGKRKRKIYYKKLDKVAHQKGKLNILNLCILLLTHGLIT